ncbi:hypothetical protein AVEN_110068-1 [Araneus ventricosus]|uniref:Integrase zinc-binding domain-containing protein n=1 Tax=Araneus ventricosus TaxID=182803 RepID=A0A4Y2S8H6_ARAVE|nr:hypothetical protein AVEN_110065-1 [Araneus ventricosus]GBN84251.1 hypothetical protein AVEN_110068-1 [Araneus ventricosus]
MLHKKVRKCWCVIPNDYVFHNSKCKSGSISEWSSENREEYTQTIEVYEENKILKLLSRLILGQDPEDFVRPTLLQDHPIVRRFTDYAHQTFHHAGVQITLSHLRERFWIPWARRVIIEVLQKCVTCRRCTLKPLVSVVPAPLTLDRINLVPAFEVTGADLTGPIYLKGGEKAWIVIFMCAIYCAIHLELVTSLYTEAFMQAMRRFFLLEEGVDVLCRKITELIFWERQELSALSTGKKL